MNRLRLTEFATTRSVELSSESVTALRRIVRSLTVTPSTTVPGTWDLTPGAEVGTVALDGLEVSIAPKVGIGRLMFLLSYAARRARWLPEDVGYDDEPDLVELVLIAFQRALREALGRGLLRGYRTEEAALLTVRGRIDFNEQLRKRFGRMPPVEVRYDDYAEDIVVNQLLKSALARTRRLHIRSWSLSNDLRRSEFALAEVSTVEFDPRQLPDITFNRLNEHYRPAVELAKLILRSLSIEQGTGGSRASAFLVNMNAAFEDFVVIALREALATSTREFPQGARGRSISLDEAGRVSLEPDLSWWDGSACVFVGDVKYKRVKAEGVLHPDLYQLLAYTVALDLPAGLLIYAKGEADDLVHQVRFAGKELHVHAVDLGGTPADILNQIDHVATLVKTMRARTPKSRPRLADAIA